MNFSSVINGFVLIFMNFGILCEHFGTVTQCLVEPTMPVLLTAKPLETSQKPNFGRNLRESVSALVIGRLPIFFHDCEGL